MAEQVKAVVDYDLEYRVGSLGAEMVRTERAVRAAEELSVEEQASSLHESMPRAMTTKKRFKLCEGEPIELEDSRAYCPIVFAPLSSLAAVLADLKFSNKGKCVLVSSNVVGCTRHKQAALDSLRSAGWNVSDVEVPDRQFYKTPATYLDLVDKLLDEKVDRKTLIIALGGGTTLDIVGFPAATVLRGLQFVSIPTSLSAMVDAPVEGKTGLNTKHGRDMMGAFWQPCLVLVPIEALKTLDFYGYGKGHALMVKHAVFEESGAFFEWLEENAEVLANERPGHLDAVEYAVRRCLEIKAAVVGDDEGEDGKRALLNLGHTVGRAIEHVTKMLPQAVADAIGTVAEARLVEIRGDAPAGLAKRIAALLRKFNLPYALPKQDVHALMDAVFMNTKHDGGNITRITISMPKAIGNVGLVEVGPEELRQTFESLESNMNLLN